MLVIVLWIVLWIVVRVGFGREREGFRCGHREALRYCSTRSIRVKVL